MLRFNSASSTDNCKCDGAKSKISVNIQFQYDLIDLQYHVMWTRDPTEPQWFQHSEELSVWNFQSLYGENTIYELFFYIIPQWSTQEITKYSMWI